VATDFPGQRGNDAGDGFEKSRLAASVSRKKKVAAVAELDRELGRGEDDFGVRFLEAGFVADAEAFGQENRWFGGGHSKLNFKIMEIMKI
jgi:hypothetical protein